MSQLDPSIFLSAAEVSGDIAGARLAMALRAARPEIRLFGCGGSRMAEAGVRLDVPTSDLGVIGLFEVLSFLPRLARAFRRIRTVVNREKPGVAVLIGYEGFHVPLAWWLRQRGIHTVSYLPPQVWLWGALARPIARSYDEILACVPDEERIYRAGGGRVTFVGHYLKDVVSPPPLPDRQAIRTRLSLAEDERVIALLPGSRWPEVRSFTATLLGAAARLRRLDQRLRFILPVADSCYHEFIHGEVERLAMSGQVILSDDSVEAMSISELGLLASGTAALEASLLGLPMVIVYRLSRLTVAIIRLLQALRVITYNRIGLPNLLLGQDVVPELYQRQASPEKVAGVAWSLLQNRDLYAETRRRLLGIRSLLGEGRSAERAAGLLLDRLKTAAND